jgi:hypothetical protein
VDERARALTAPSLLQKPTSVVDLKSYTGAASSQRNFKSKPHWNH